jgi:hypothetical protein
MGTPLGNRRALVVALALTGATGLTSLGLSSPAAANPAASAVSPASSVQVERACAAPTAPGTMACMALRRVDSGIHPDLPSGFGPSNLQSAYALSSNGGAGQTVAIVDAYNDPNVTADLNTYRSTFGLPALTSGQFKVVNENGAASPLPTNDSGWAGEIALDVEMVSAIAPAANIILVEANSANDADLYGAENTAVNLGAKFVSNSWGGSEYSGQTTDDSNFNHPGVAITVSSGDSGYGAEYPATSKYVTAVGGTSLSTASNSRGWTESAWSGAGSGCSAYDATPTWQTVTTGCGTKRGEADVSAVADPNTGVAVYQTYGASGWTVYGGTSVASPIVASIYADAGTPGSSDYPASYPYAHQSNLNDVTSGSNGSCGAKLCTAGTGWDGPTGLGTANGTAAFTAGSSNPGSPTVNNPGSQSTVVGTSVSLQLSASGGTAPYTWSATGLPAGLSISSSGLISGSPTTAGSYSVTATATDSASKTGSATFSWTVTTSGGGGCTAAQLLSNPGFETGSASPWTASSGVVSSTSDGETAHSGSYYAWLDGYGVSHTDTLSQSITIPASCKTATLTFWLKIDTQETTTTTAYDKLTVKAGSTTLATYSNLNHGGYAQKSFSLSAFIGQSVTVTFTGTEDSSLATSFVIAAPGTPIAARLPHGAGRRCLSRTREREGRSSASGVPVVARGGWVAPVPGLRVHP